MKTDQGEGFDTAGVIEAIAVRVRLTALFVLAIGPVLLCAFFVILAQDGLRDLGELASWLCGALGTLGLAAFLALLAKDFRAGRWWTFDIVEYLTLTIWLYPKRLRDGIHDERMRRAFGLEDNYDNSSQSASEPGAGANEGGGIP